MIIRFEFLQPFAPTSTYAHDLGNLSILYVHRYVLHFACLLLCIQPWSFSYLLLFQCRRKQFFSSLKFVLFYREFFSRSMYGGWIRDKEIAGRTWQRIKPQAVEVSMYWLIKLKFPNLKISYCIFLSVRPKLLVTFHYEILCSGNHTSGNRISRGPLVCLHLLSIVRGYKLCAILYNTIAKFKKHI